MEAEGNINAYEAAPSATPVLTTRERLLQLARKHWLELPLVAVAVYFTIHRMWFMDDAFVYLRYVDNWVLHGLGLTYNAGEFVEGYTSPLWLLILAFFRLLGASYWYLILGIAVACTLLFSYLAIRVNDALSEGQGLRVNFPLAYLCANYGMTRYFSSAAESPLVLVCAAGIALYVVRPKSRLALLLTALAPMVRHEMILAVLPAAYAVWRKERRFPWRLTVGTAVPLLAWVTFRVYYYADFFPNTFHLKNTINIGRGLTYLLNACNGYYFVFVLFAFAYPTFRTGFNRELRVRVAMLVSAALLAAYVVKVGGDYNHFRLASAPFVLATLACGGIVEGLLGKLKRRRLLITVAFSACTVIFIGQIDMTEEVGFWGDTERQWHQSRWMKNEEIQAVEQQALNLATGTQHKVFVESWCIEAYRQSDAMVINRFGLTDAYLARLDGIPSEFAGHHWQMLRPALDLKFLYIDHFSLKTVRPYKRRRIIYPGRVGGIRYAAEKRIVASWIRRNLDKLEVIEKKIYNEHNLWTNLKLALQMPRMNYK